MDVSDFETSSQHEEGVELRLYSSKLGKYSDVYIKLKGIDSTAYRTAFANMRRDSIIAEIKNEKLDSQQQEINLCLAVVVGWRGLEKDGEPYEYSEDNCRDWLIKAPYLRDQILKFIEDRANFIKG